MLSNWERFHKGIHQHGLYSGEDPAVDGILEDLVQEQIVDIGNHVTLSLGSAVAQW